MLRAISKNTIYEKQFRQAAQMTMLMLIQFFFAAVAGICNCYLKFLPGTRTTPSIHSSRVRKYCLLLECHTVCASILCHQSFKKLSIKSVIITFGIKSLLGSFLLLMQSLFIESYAHSTKTILVACTSLVFRCTLTSIALVPVPLTEIIYLSFDTTKVSYSLVLKP